MKFGIDISRNKSNEKIFLQRKPWGNFNQIETEIFKKKDKKSKERVWAIIKDEKKKKRKTSTPWLSKQG